MPRPGDGAEGGRIADARPVVLVVDDHPDLVQVVRFAMQREGYRVYEAADGRVALDLLRAVRPDVIVLDLAMPGMDGWAFRAAQRALPGMRDLPVVVFSGEGPADPPSPELAPSAVFPKGAGVGRLVTVVRSLLPPSDASARDQGARA